MEVFRRSLAESVELVSVRTDKFKTGVFSVSLALPLEAEQATATALLGDVLYRGSRRYPDIEAISLATDELYGASVGPFVRQRGESQCVGFSASFLDDRYALDGNAVLEPVLSLIGELLLEPLTEGGAFREEYVRSEGANLADQIRARVNDKRGWSVFRLTQEMCAGEAYALDKLGRAEEAERMTAARLWERYQTVLREAKVVFYYGGSASLERVEAAVRESFAPLLTDRRMELPCVVKGGPEGAVREITDRMDVTQGKLALGFRTGGIVSGHPDYPALLVCNAMYGGTTNSKLFLNVREKLSLCYFASSMMDKLKGLMVVSSGVEFSKFQVAKDEILAQLEAVRRGDFSGEELAAAKQALTGSLRACLDSQGRLEDYWTGQALSGGKMEGPEKLIRPIEGVTAEDVRRAARAIELDTVYYLTGREAR
jgi:predicted Zn-dependent peptidase